MKNTDFAAGPMRGSGAKPLEKFKVKQKQEIRSQAIKRTQLQDPMEEWTETKALSPKMLELEMLTQMPMGTSH